MLLDYGADVTMQDGPDLAAVLGGERFYAEVKHFNRKAQDDINDAAVRNAPEFEFVLQEDTTRIEDKSPYRQIADVAIKKADQSLARTGGNQDGNGAGKVMTGKACLDAGRREQRIEVDICKIRIAGLKMAKCGL